MYVYQEYPKCLYMRNGVTMTVVSEEEEVAMAEIGWLTAEQVQTAPVPEEEPDTEQRKKRK